MDISEKVVQTRDGSCSRTADELRDVFVSDACGLLDENPQVEEYNATELGEMDEADRSAALEIAVSEYEQQLNAAGYTVVWDDGYVIYKDLTDEEADELNG